MAGTDENLRAYSVIIFILHAFFVILSLVGLWKQKRSRYFRARGRKNLAFACFVVFNFFYTYINGFEIADISSCRFFWLWSNVFVPLFILMTTWPVLKVIQDNNNDILRPSINFLLDKKKMLVTYMTPWIIFTIAGFALEGQHGSGMIYDDATCKYNSDVVAVFYAIFVIFGAAYVCFVTYLVRTLCPFEEDTNTGDMDIFKQMIYFLLCALTMAVFFVMHYLLIAEQSKFYPSFWIMIAGVMYLEVFIVIPFYKVWRLGRLLEDTEADDESENLRGPGGSLGGGPVLKRFDADALAFDDNNNNNNDYHYNSKSGGSGGNNNSSSSNSRNSFELHVMK